MLSILFIEYNIITIYLYTSTSGSIIASVHRVAHCDEIFN